MEEKKKKANFKILVPIIILIIMGVIIGGVVMTSKEGTLKVKSEVEEQPKEERECLETSYMTIDGVFVDNAYQDKENENLRLVYLFYTVHSNDKNLKVDSSSAKLLINDTNKYENTKHLDKVCNYMSSYYYSDYLEDVYVGTPLKVVETFKVPVGDLQSGKTLKIEKTQIPETEKIHMLTDNIVFLDNAEMIAQKVDAEGYANELNKRADADAATITRVKNAINGYEWSFYVNTLAYKLTFDNPNQFELRTMFGANEGTYAIKNGYIIGTYPDTGTGFEIPYSWKADGDIDLDLVKGFDVSQ